VVYVNVWLHESTAGWRTVLRGQLPVLNPQMGSDLGLGLVSAFISDFYLQHCSGEPARVIFLRNWRNLE